LRRARKKKYLTALSVASPGFSFSVTGAMARYLRKMSVSRGSTRPPKDAIPPAIVIVIATSRQGSRSSLKVSN
jgi:hypothetical protein